MDYIIARIITRRAENLRTIISDVSAYDIPSLENAVDYNDELKLDDSQWFRILAFSEKEYCPDYLKNGFNIAELSTISREEFEKIKFIFSFQSSEYYLFQRLFKSSVIENKKILSFQDEPQLKEDKTMVIVNTLPDAIYVKNSDTLYFKDLSKIAPIFSGIDILLEEATDDEVDSFLGLDLISTAQGFDKQKVTKSNRKRVRNALRQYNLMNEEDKSAIREYIKHYRPALRYDEQAKAFEVSCDNDCKDLMFGIDQRYYTTGIGNHKRIANTVTPL